MQRSQTVSRSASAVSRAAAAAINAPSSAGWQDLPRDVQEVALSKLSLKNLTRAGAVSKNMRSMTGGMAQARKAALTAAATKARTAGRTMIASRMAAQLMRTVEAAVAQDAWARHISHRFTQPQPRPMLLHATNTSTVNMYVTFTAPHYGVESVPMYVEFVRNSHKPRGRQGRKTTEMEATWTRVVDLRRDARGRPRLVPRRDEWIEMIQAAAGEYPATRYDQNIDAQLTQAVATVNQRYAAS
jgi:hypothetical protein